ncbi:RNA methyltransferase [Paenibacillus albicereus]|uniref:RNA methyltransferase n=1 Tax=Paenibacillus albicereus TaxID=2726185 RepID=A0A6H2GSW2_9BACL|nr:RNA methyltransferase [Paenibacillus albicereus]QJC50487.1 RNA methyltransferase [Paenibacillus albicereus]
MNPTEFRPGDGFTASVRDYLYIYACHESEAELCALELSCLFPGFLMTPDSRAFRHARRLDPSRSPFLKQRLDIRAEAASEPELLEAAGAVLSPGERLFRARYVKTGALDQHPDRRRLELERALGLAVTGEPELKRPDVVYGLTRHEGRWLAGELAEAEPLWLRHQDKPRQYSTALPTRAARAAVNIAAPGEPAGSSLVDPCCGIGTVLLEALSLGFSCRGNDLNPLAAVGARENLRHFGHAEELVSIGDMRGLSGAFDAGVLDMPYNLCSVSPPEEQLGMLIALRRLTGRAVVVTTEPIEAILQEAGFRIEATARLTKGNFVRLFHLCLADG